MEKMWDSINTLNKGLEEIKKKQTVMNNTITEIKDTLEGINSRITEAEEWISEVEWWKFHLRMVEITAKEQNKEKKQWEKLRTVSETSEAISNAPIFKL